MLHAVNQAATRKTGSGKPPPGDAELEADEACPLRARWHGDQRGSSVAHGDSFGTAVVSESPGRRADGSLALQARCQGFESPRLHWLDHRHA
jgi:hypothetical protein